MGKASDGGTNAVAIWACHRIRKQCRDSSVGHGLDVNPGSDFQKLSREVRHRANAQMAESKRTGCRARIVDQFAEGGRLEIIVYNQDIGKAVDQTSPERVSSADRKAHCDKASGEARIRPRQHADHVSIRVSVGRLIRGNVSGRAWDILNDHRLFELLRKLFSNNAKADIVAGREAEKQAYVSSRIVRLRVTRVRGHQESKSRK